MKIARNIEISKCEETVAENGPRWTEPRGLVSAVHVEVRPGFFVHVALGSAGVQIWRGDHRVGVPIEALIQVAATLNPEAFGPPQSSPIEALETSTAAP
jgi:hypothetical protein